METQTKDTENHGNQNTVKAEEATMEEKNEKSDEISRHNQLMSFMTDFRGSVEKSIKDTNDKLDRQMREVSKEVNEMNTKLAEHENEERSRMERMDERLKMLEKEMKRTSLVKQRRNALLQKEEQYSAADWMEDRTKPARQEAEQLGNKMNEANKSDKRYIDDEDLQKKKKKKQFERRTINQEDLENRIETEQNTSLSSSYKSTWAQKMEAELTAAAESAGRMEHGDRVRYHRQSEGREKDNQGWRFDLEKGRDKKSEENSWQEIRVQDKVPDSEELPAGWKTKKQTPKTRIMKPITNWFSYDDNSSSSSSSEGSQEEESWEKVDRERKNKLKKLRSKERLKEKMETVASKSRMMLGVGPIDVREVEELEAELGSLEKAEKRAVRNFLERYLDFNTKELNLINILETKTAAAGDIIYFALDEHEHIKLKEIQFRRAAIQ